MVFNDFFEAPSPMECGINRNVIGIRPIKEEYPIHDIRISYSQEESGNTYKDLISSSQSG